MKVKLNVQQFPERMIGQVYENTRKVLKKTTKEAISKKRTDAERKAIKTIQLKDILNQK